MSYRTVVMSDLHLGSKGCKSDEILKFLDALDCYNLILNGDIIDGWALNRGSKWKEKHTKIVRKILKMAEKELMLFGLEGTMMIF